MLPAAKKNSHIEGIFPAALLGVLITSYIRRAFDETRTRHVGTHRASSGSFCVSSWGSYVRRFESEGTLY